ncbi:four-helix bundle copper-binding protein [Lentibacillus cibarius]|uniref:Four-helix bundle copper-binding protein n=1 Tax=Lentibacillus cibarius TaxID=2583219 RepID=A0A549YHZ0_9BACI|nr:four-helix bundle copper-binding protein [Lentibacillus cibarius]TRM11502.1 four-helix bundle copper-binding protein [Lentibacillus cibarius]
MGVLSTSPTAMDNCIEACLKCMRACEECTMACLFQEPDVQARATCIQTLNDCAEICALAGQYMSRSSTFSAQFCGVCANVCEQCATECEKFKDTHCQECAAICRQCAEACRKMAG